MKLTFSPLLAVLAIILAGCTSGHTVSIKDLRVEMKKNPVGIGVSQPRFMWKISSESPDLMQTSYQIQVAESPDNLKNGKELLAVEVYERTWTWLHERGCAHLIPAQILEQYAMAISRWIQCEECITEYGFLAKHPTTGNAIPSPYVSMSQSFSKQANNLWYQIYQVVRENCAVEYWGATPHDDMMERLLTARRGG